jgi:hypothetical protein
VAEQADDLTLSNFETNVIYGDRTAVTSDKVLGNDHHALGLIES